MGELSEDDKVKVARPGRSKGSCRSPSRWPRSSLEKKESSCPWSRPFKDLRKSWPVNTITCRKLPSTWSDTSRKWLSRRRNLPLKEEFKSKKKKKKKKVLCVDT